MDIPNQKELQLLHSKICQAVADENRIQILYALHHKPCYVTELSELLGIAQPTISRHLSLLRQRNIVKSERNGATVVYSLTDDRIIDALNIMRDLLHDLIQTQADSLDS